MSEISDKRDYYQQRIMYWNLKLSKLEENCHHDNVSAKYKANTGNWCETDDVYWVEVKCKDCGKYFTVNSEDREGYHYWGSRVE